MGKKVERRTGEVWYSRNKSGVEQKYRADNMIKYENKRRKVEQGQEKKGRAET